MSEKPNVIERLLHAALAAVEQELAELRKRPTLEEVLAAVDAWIYSNRHALSRWIDAEQDEESLEGRVRALYAEMEARP